MKLVFRFICLAALLVLPLVGGTGCKSAESENISSRPWNTPRGFDSGLPGFDQYRR